MLFSSDKENIYTCVIYTRISDQEPEEISPDDTIEAQRDICEAFLKTRPHWKFISTRYDDRNASGGTLDRPALKRLLHDAEQGKFNMIIIKSIDRFSRDLQQFFEIQPKLEKLGINLCCAQQTFSTNDATGRLILQIMLSFAEFERQLASERTRDRMRKRAKGGLFHGGYPPLGFDFIPRKKGYLLKNQKEARLVHQIFEKYIEIQSAHLVAKHFNDLGHRSKLWTTKKKHRKGGSKFTEGVILNILKNYTYIGKTFVKAIRANQKDEFYKAKWKPIISKAMFDKVQSILKSNAQSKGSISENKYKFLLTGLVRCSYCKSYMTPNYSLTRKKPYLYYKCTAVDKADKDACKIKSTPARELEDRVVERIKFLSKNPTILKAAITAAMKQSKNKIPGLQKEKNEIQGKITRIKNKANPLIASLGQRRNSLVQSELEKLDEQKSALENRLSELSFELDRERLKVMSPDLVIQNFGIFRDVFESLPFEKQRDLLHLFIKEIIYFKDPTKLQIHFWDIPEIKEPPDKPKKGKSGGSSSPQNPDIWDFDKRTIWLPEQDSQRTNSKVITEEIPYYYKWHNKTKTLFRGPKPAFIQAGKIITQREQEHHDFVESYKNPIEKAMEYARMMQEEKLSQNSLAKKLGISRVRVTQILNLLKLPQEQQAYIIENGKEQQIMERQLRKC